MVKSRLKLPRRLIALFQFILESYEGIFSVSTEDVQGATIAVSVPQGLWEEGRAILESLREEIPYEELSLTQEG